MITMWILITFSSPFQGSYPISHSPPFKTLDACNEFKTQLPIKSNYSGPMLCVSFTNPK